MQNKKSKTIWGVFLLGFGLIWIGSNLGILKPSAFSGLIVSFILILFGVHIIFRGKQGERETDKTIEDNSSPNYSGEAYTEEEAFQRETEEDYTQYTYDSYTGDEEYKRSDNIRTENPRRENTGAEKGNAGKKNYTGILASNKVQCTDEFTGAELTVVAGNIELDLRNAVISRDIVIDVNCFLGGIDIFLPSGVEVSVSCVPIMGGVESKINGTFTRKENKATVYIRGTCFMGGIEIR